MLDTLSSSADSLCPGDGVVFTCCTDTGRLVWDIKDSTVSFHSPAHLNNAIQLNIFTITLQNITGNIYHSTATADHVPINYNGTTVACRGQNIENKQQMSIVIGVYGETLNIIFINYLQSLHHLLLSI